MSRTEKLHLFQGFGIEMEYMIVNQHSLKVMPICHDVLAEMAGSRTREHSLGSVAWSNELVLHVIELKSDGPAHDLNQLHKDFFVAIKDMNARLEKYEAMLLPTAMHPFFDPNRETQLWPDEDAVIYQTYQNIFDCRSHGWSNLQSIHINLPFFDDEEFGVLHAAVRSILPLLPAVAASSPIVLGNRGPQLDSRLSFYMQNQKKVPAIIGQVIPEDVYTKYDYQEKILKPMYKGISALDPEGTLQDEWLNSRAAIARFQRNAIEIRILDIGECLTNDFAIIKSTVNLIRDLVDEKWAPMARLKAMPTQNLRHILDQILLKGLDTEISDFQYLALFGFNEKATVRDIWLKVASLSPMLEIVRKGPLSKRILQHLGDQQRFEHGALVQCYRQLANCLATDTAFGF